jgi:nitrous oxide reductase accessory protein NosL
MRTLIAALVRLIFVAGCGQRRQAVASRPGYIWPR